MDGVSLHLPEQCTTVRVPADAGGLPVVSGRGETLRARHGRGESGRNAPGPYGGWLLPEKHDLAKKRAEILDEAARQRDR